MVKVCTYTDCFDELTSALEANGIEYTSDECLGRCDLCHSTSFVQVDEEFLSDDSIEKLIIKIKQH